MPELIFPSDLDVATFPHLQFISFKRNTDSGTAIPFGAVLIYCHPNISFGDGINYAAVDLGPLGEMGMNIGKGLFGGLSQVPSAVAGVAGQAASIANLFNGGLSTAAALYASKFLPTIGFDPGSVVSLSTRSVLNPNTNTLFENVNTRTFAFSFNLVARNPVESIIIKQIIQFFRVNMYPEKHVTGLLLSYPNTWIIRNKYLNNDNFFIPGIHECFLTGLTTDYNEATNAFHAEGAPFNVAINLQFMETRALTRADILWYEHDSLERPADLPPF